MRPPCRKNELNVFRVTMLEAMVTVDERVLKDGRRARFRQWSAAPPGSRRSPSWTARAASEGGLRASHCGQKQLLSGLYLKRRGPSIWVYVNIHIAEPPQE